MLLLQRNDTGVQLWGYESDHHALSRLPGVVDAQAVLGRHHLALIGIARHWVLADKYGDFAPYNSMLEAGMAQAQLQHLTRALGWPAETIEGRPDTLRAAMRLSEHPLETVAFGMRFTPPALAAAGSLAWQAASQPTAVATVEPAPGMATRFGRLPQLAAQFAAIGPAAAASLPAPAVAAVAAVADTSRSAGRCGLLGLMRQRSSGNDAPGLAPQLAPLPAGARNELLALWRGLAAQRTTLPGEESLRPLLLWLEGGSGGPGLFDIDGRRQPLPPGADLAALLQQSLPSTRVRHNLAALKCHALWCADLAQAERRHGVAALRRLHLAAGAQAQDLSLAATALGLFARPLRMLREAVLEGGLCLPGPLVYQVMCGLNRSTNTRWEI